MEDEREALYRHDTHYTADTDHVSSTEEGRDIRRNNDDNSENTTEESKKSASLWNLLFGHVCGVFVAICWAASAACSQALGGYVPTFQLNMLRFGSAFVVIAPVVFCRGLSIFPEQTRCHAAYVFLFCVIAVADNLLYYESSIFLPVSALGGMEATCLRVLTTLLTLVLQRSLRCSTLVSVAMSVTGIIFVTQPQFLFEYLGSSHEIGTTPVCFHPVRNKVNHFNATETNHDQFDAIEQSDNVWTNTTNATMFLDTNQQKVIRDYVKGCLLIVGSSLGYVLEMAVQQHRLQDMNVYVIIFWMCLTGTLLSGAVMLSVETPTFPTSPICILLLLGHSACAAAASILAVTAVSLISPVTYSLLNSLQLVLFLVAQYTVLKNVNLGYGNWAEVVGAILVLCASIFEATYTVYTRGKDK